MPSLRTASVASLTAVVVAGCSFLGAGDADPDTDRHGFDPSVSMTMAGVDLAESVELADRAPRYDVRADITPGRGAVDGRVTASLPVGADTGEVRLRYLAGLDSLDADARVGRVSVDGEPVRARVEGSIVSVPLPPGHGRRVELVVPFSYELERTGSGGILDALGGMGGVGEVGLLGRHEDLLALGHWFPIWVPAPHSSEPEPAGFGDIGNFPAALIRAELTVPEGWTVVDGGVGTRSVAGPHRTRFRTEGYGIRDLAVAVVRGYASRELPVAGLPGVTVRAWAPTAAKGDLEEVLEEAALSLRVLSERFTDYPWRELDVVSTPLGAGVAGMEWPGAVWIEPSVFGGGVPGLGSLGGLLGDVDPGDLGGLEDLLGEDVGRMLATTRLWTLAHEVGHQWWHVLVGNDSLLDPAVDEPLAQYSACLVVHASEQPDPDAVCRAQIRSGYEQMRLMGTADSAVAQQSDDFASSLQYAGVVYGKAAAFYQALAERFGSDRIAHALGLVTRERAFAMLTTEELRDALADGLGEEPAFDRMWRRWMTEAHGDRDLDVG